MHAAAQNAKEVKIQAQRVINEKVVARITGGGKIIELTLSYPVSFADLDITSASEISPCSHERVARSLMFT